jgi:hypothetical protein
VRELLFPFYAQQYILVEEAAVELAVQVVDR